MYLIVKLILTLPVIPCALGRNLPMKEPKSLVYEDFFSGSHLLLVMEFRVFRRPPVFKLEFVVGVAEYPWALLRESGSHSPSFWVGMVDFMGTGLLEEEVDDLRGAVDFLFSSMLSLKN